MDWLGSLVARGLLVIDLPDQSYTAVSLVTCPNSTNRWTSYRLSVLRVDRLLLGEESVMIPFAFMRATVDAPPSASHWTPPPIPTTFNPPCNRHSRSSRQTQSAIAGYSQPSLLHPRRYERVFRRLNALALSPEATIAMWVEEATNS